MINILNKQKPKCILELGSGFSTVLLSDYCSKNNAQVITLEHDKQYFDETSQLLLDNNLSNFGTLILSPLQTTYSDSKMFTFYSPDNISKRDYCFDFVFVDGPPKSVDEHARSGLSQKSFSSLLDKNCIILMDDYYRTGEQSVVKEWVKEGFVTIESVNHSLEKKAVLLKICDNQKLHPELQ